MGRDFILGAALVVVGGLIMATAISGTTGSILSVFLAPGALSVINPVAGTFRTAGGEQGTSPTDPRGNGPPPAEPKGTTQATTIPGTTTTV